MRVEVSYFDDCPHRGIADVRLAQALSASGHGATTVDRRRAETTGEAERVGRSGSPTDRVDGADPFATGDEHVGLSFRVYPTPDGSPTLERLIEAPS